MKRKYITISCIIAIISLAGCIKDKGNNFANQKTPNPHLIEFVQEPLVLHGAVSISDTPQEFTFYAEENSADNVYPASSITIASDTTIVNSYNTDPGNLADKKFIPFEQMPDSTFEIENLTASLDPSSHLAAFKIKVFSNKLDPAHSYALGFKITSATNNVPISGNTSKKIVNIGPKNQYDGIYTSKTYTFRSGDPSRTGYDNSETYTLVTTGLHSLIFSDLQKWVDGSGVAIGQPELFIDPNTNMVTITSSGGGSNDPSYNSHYDPSSKTFYISFTWGAGPSARLATDTLTYVGPR